MRTFKFFVSIFFLLSFHSVQAQKVILSEGLNLQLDAETAYPLVMGSTFQYCKDIQAISYFNKLTNTIKFFDYQTGSVIRQTKLEMAGPNAVGSDIFYTHYHNKDSIFIISHFNNFQLGLVNIYGEKINTFNLINHNKFENVQIPKAPRIFGAIEVFGSELFLAVQISSLSKRNRVAPIIRLNMKSGNFSYLGYPLPYADLDIGKVVWSNQVNFYETRLTINSNNELIINYPLEHQFYTYDVQTKKSRSINIESKLIGEFKLLTSDRSNFQSTDFEYKDMIHNSALYQGIIYDPFKNLIYRIGRVEGNSKLLKRKLSGELVNRVFEYVVSVFDSRFNFLAETKFTSKQAMFERGVFVGPDGLFVVEPNLKGEDILGLALITIKE